MKKLIHMSTDELRREWANLARIETEQRLRIETRREEQERMQRELAA